MKCTEGRSHCMGGECVRGMCLEVKIALSFVVAFAVAGLLMQRRWTGVYDSSLVQV
jgi:hypothetical protein